jgi:hypothetical protein
VVFIGGVDMPDKAKKGDWVQIHKIVLPAGERAPQVPEDTAQVPLEMKVKGTLLDQEASLGDTVSIRTAVGRVLEGTLVAINPSYDISYGPPPAELRSVWEELRKILKGGDC